MKVISTNISTPKILFNGKKNITTGIFKEPVEEGIFLNQFDVKNDTVVDRKYHGGLDKACYLYSANHYPFWKEKYTNFDWKWGMFGENLTIDGLDEKEIFIGDEFSVGDAIIQVSEPRRPCNTLALRFDDKKMIKTFLNNSFCGIYVRVLKNGLVTKENALKRINRVPNSLSIEQVYSLFSYNKTNLILKNKALELPLLSQDCKNSIQKLK